MTMRPPFVTKPMQVTKPTGGNAQVSKKPTVVTKPMRVPRNPTGGAGANSGVGRLNQSESLRGTKGRNVK